MTHRVRPLTTARRGWSASGSSRPRRCRRPDFDPSYAVDFWDLTNRQDWSAVESVQRSLVSPAFVPGVLAEQEDAVYQLVTMVARGYLGEALVPLAAYPSAHPSQPAYPQLEVSS